VPVNACVSYASLLSTLQFVMASSSLSFLLSLVLLGGASAQTSFTCANSDNSAVCTALSTIYTATGGASWTNKTGWGTGTSYCTPWFGLTCTSGNIVKMTFGSYFVTNNLVGTLPDIWDKFTSLTLLSIGANAQLTGSLPSTLFGLVPPPSVYLTNSGLSGPVPLSYLSNLASVSLVYGGSSFTPSFGPITVSASSSSSSSSSFDPTSLLASLAALNNTQLALAATAAGQNSSVGTQQTQLNALIASNAAMNTTNSALSASNAAMNRNFLITNRTNARRRLPLLAAREPHPLTKTNHQATLPATQASLQSRGSV